MADITVVSSTASAQNGKAQRPIIWVSALVGYAVFIDSSSDLKYYKTTDSGQTWGAAVNISTGTVHMHACYFDQRTPGDSGTLIHIAWSDTGTDDVFYITLDTNGDTLGTLRTVVTQTSGALSVSAHLSITKARGGNLYIVFCIDAAAETGTYRSTDGGVNWTVRTNLHEVAANDFAMLFPGNYADANDIDCLYYDHSATAWTLKTHDDSADTNAESSTIATVTALSSDGTSQYPFSGAIRHSDGHLIAVVVTERDPAGVTADIRVFDINGSGSITELTAIATNIDDCYHATVYIDNNTDDIYVCYTGKRDGSETLGTTVGIYYTKSTDGGTTWSAGDTAYSAGTGNYVQTYQDPGGNRFGPLFRNGAVLTYNFDNSLNLTPSVGGNRRRRVLMGCAA
jgi:hypothetical protein